MSSVIDVPVGPQHPALKEPINITCYVDGEQVVGAKLRLGYNHRGIEKAGEYQTYIQNIYVAERICGICGIVHVYSFVQAVEDIIGKEIPRRADYIRTIGLELNRIHSHLLWLGVAAHEIGFDTLFMYVWRDRELVMDIIEEVTGNRVTYALVTIGGVRRDIPQEASERILRVMDAIEERIKKYKKMIMEEKTIRMRCDGVGILSREDAIALCAVGPMIRASGVSFDIRAVDPHAAYDEIPFNVIVYNTCDVTARILVRVDEVLESINIIREAIKRMPKGPIRVRLPRVVPVGEGIGRTEAPRGEVIHYVRANGTEKPFRWKIRAPSLANFLTIPTMLTSKGDYVVNIADVPVAFASIDPCMSCTDRAVKFVDVSTGKSWTWTLEQIKRMYWR
ncbi:MAG: nickel-dependent hydrogenase large subunit [Candidatus Nezhaarchaeota archaeon]|nr:nickel-dependent hydrogenase large subunit [Candidatus Nezhaarchaeota archaeon]MCX8142226.1 nickel-dependent hydrogenase large subunit [Candidatus Nezhaarchaeota archaeon]MDW8050801.1 nickel-dependent hydrogenase large subunit [Nitrososphaerota archaeon]